MPSFSLFKENLSELLIKKISPISKEINKLNKDISYIDQVLKEGSEKANELSSKKIEDIKKKFGFWELFALKNPILYLYLLNVRPNTNNS